MKSRVVKLVFTSAVGSAFFIASAVVALAARRYQVRDQSMPNGKGGLMTYQDGYHLALVLFLLAVASFLAARKSLRAHESGN